MNAKTRVKKLESASVGTRGLAVGHIYGDGPVIFEGRELDRDQFEALARERNMEPLVVHYVNDWREGTSG